ncbi:MULTISPECIES: hypothetical protein [unclassified Streptomyces]|uniref:hypothetical protein n=1 Tax=unclassified Streptomyces TaxID=2593676 RepID=UPI002DD991C0|nr:MULTISPECIES: hypothetical protein [unclassified Streptomyces]WSA91428.1 hypothetical protein OIE63_07550 [Streptomyces sp. NBC_01795]WSB75752.1 hypothetical protein OHB04_08075 [Streptomyces sp. NBC_01775]WSS44781.1 hypothetical protein OG220_32490 [Streptomyces sp. NBC_01187]
MGDGDYRDAQTACHQIQRLSDDHWHALDTPCRAMDDNAWVGPAGRLFKDEVNGLRRELQTQLTKAVQDADDKLHSLPRQP